MSGIGIQYSASEIVHTKYQRFAGALVIGRRMLPQAFVRAADIRPVELHDLLPADVRFKLLFFVGELTKTRIAELNALAEELSKPSSILHKYSADGNISTVFDILTIMTGKKTAINHLDVPPFFRPHWSKLVVSFILHSFLVYEGFGIDPKQITLVVVRPDGYVGTIVPLTAMADLHDYFGSFLVPRVLDSTTSTFAKVVTNRVGGILHDDWERWTFAKVRGGWAENEKRDTLSNYLLDELRTYGSGYSDALAPFPPRDANKSLAGEPALVRTPTIEELRVTDSPCVLHRQH